MKVGSLFSGIGGLDLGLEKAGMQVVWQSEIDDFACKVLEKHWPGIPNHGDITQIDWNNVEPVDLICGGFPCQDISFAGKRAGIQVGNRSGLWYQFAKAIDHLRPRYVVIENVRAMLSPSRTPILEWPPCNHCGCDELNEDLEKNDDGFSLCPVCGRTVFPRTVGYDVRAAAIDSVLGSLASLGYDAEWTVYRAANFGAPHQRDRLFIVAYAQGERSGEAGGLRYTGPEEWPAGSCQTAAMADADAQRGEEGSRHRGRPARDRIEYTRQDAREASALADTEHAGQPAAEEPGSQGAPAAQGRPDRSEAHDEREIQRSERPRDPGSAAERASRIFQPAIRSDHWNDWEPERGRDGTLRLVKPGVCVIADGIRDRIPAIRALGNAVVPQVAEHIGRCIIYRETGEWITN